MTASPAPEVTFGLRHLRDSDRAFCRSSFLEWLHETEHCRTLTFAEMKAVFRPQIDTVLDTFDVRVAHPEGDEDEIAGWIAWSLNTVGYCYVKRDPWRKMGVSRILLNAAGVSTHCRALYWSERAMKLARLKGLQVDPVSYIQGMAFFAGKR